MSFQREEFFRVLESIDKEYYSFKDFIVALLGCTDAENMKDAINAWLRFKSSVPEDVFFCNMIDACIFYHLLKTALSMGNDDDAEDFRRRMVDSWNSANVAEEHNDPVSIAEVDVTFA